MIERPDFFNLTIAAISYVYFINNFYFSSPFLEVYGPRIFFYGVIISLFYDLVYLY